MLIEYSVENFRSIAEPITVTMLPAKGTSKPGNLIKVDKNKNIKKLLKSCVIYGANASGKTNLIFALSIMKYLVINSKNFNAGDKLIGYLPFILDNDHPNKPTTFKIHFIKEDIEYKYSFSFNLDRVMTEELSSSHEGKREKYIFKRQNNDFEPFQDRNELTSLFRNTGENVLFLSKANNEYKDFRPIFEWFNNDLIATSSTPNLFMPPLTPQFTIDYMNRSDEHKHKVLNLLHHADFNIFDISGKNIPFGSPKTLENFKSFLLSMTSEISKAGIVNKENQPNLDKMQLQGGFFPEFKTIRKKTDSSEVVIQDFIPFESAGTNQFFNIAGLWLDALQDETKLLIIDEFDIRLHPDLQFYLIQLFHDPEINQKNSQLIFTSHNTQLLSRDIFRREQIIFTEKNPETQSTERYYLYDYEKRQDRSLEKNYFMGRYGGLPDIKYGEI
jgi:hypothetical protein